MLRRYGNDKATGRLRVEQRIVACDIGLTRHGTQVKVHAAAPGQGHLSGSNTEAPVRAVVAGTDETTLYGLRQRFVQDTGPLCIYLGYAVANGIMQGVVLRATEFSAGFAEHEDEVARLLHVHGDSTTHIGHAGHDREEQRRRHGDFGVADMVVVLHAVFTRDAWDTVGNTVVIEGLISTHKLC